MLRRLFLGGLLAAVVMWLPARPAAGGPLGDLAKKAADKAKEVKAKGDAALDKVKDGLKDTAKGLNPKKLLPDEVRREVEKLTQFGDGPTTLPSNGERCFDSFRHDMTAH